MAFLVVIGVLQFIYAVLFGNYVRFVSFLSTTLILHLLSPKFIKLSFIPSETKGYKITFQLTYYVFPCF